MKKILAFLLKSLFIVALLTSCATKPIHLIAVPSKDRLNLLKKVPKRLPGTSLDNLSESEELAKAYLEALEFEKTGDAKQACDLFSELSENSNFAIKDTALVHSLSDCDFSKYRLGRIWSNQNIANYAKENYLEISRNLAIKKNLSIYEAQFSYELIPFRLVQAEKVKLIKRAIAIAEQLNDGLSLKLYTDKLKEISPLYNVDITNQNIYSVAKDFEVNRNFEKARSLYKQIINGEFNIEEKVKAYNSYRTSYKIERDLKTFLAKTYEMEKFLNAEVAKNPEDQITIESWVDSKILLARAVWTEHQNLEARKILDELIATNLGSENQKANTQYIYGQLHLENKENTEALKRFYEANKFKITDLAVLENIQWAIIWNNYLLKDNEKVANFADEFIKKSSNQNFIVKLNYWKAKALLRLNKKEEANVVFNSLITEDPFGYYGIIASIDLQTPLQPIASTIIDTEPTGIQILDWLIAMDEKNFAQKYLKEIDSKFKTPLDREKAMSLYYQTEWFQGGMRQVYNFKQSSRNNITSKYINVIFPTPYLNSVTSLAHKYNLPGQLVYAITRQESAFIPSSRSWADAFGLMQMIPEKATELSQKYGIPYKDYNDLYNPEINLEFGTALLKDLRSKFKSKFIQSVAAYNASEEVIAVWEKERFNGNYFEFIEMIPYEETRNYIKLVFRNYIVYKQITSKEEFMLDKDFFAKPF